MADPEISQFGHKALPHFAQSPEAPVLFASQPVIITAEQETAVRRLLTLTSSDSSFAQKAADGLRVILGGGINQGVVPVIASLAPNQKGTGSGTFVLRVLGSGFDPTCVIYINGNSSPTTFTAANEVRTNMNLTSVTVPVVLPVVVIAGTGAISNTMPFTVTAGLFAASEGEESAVMADSNSPELTASSPEPTTDSTPAKSPEAWVYKGGK